MRIGDYRRSSSAGPGPSRIETDRRMPRGVVVSIRAGAGAPALLDHRDALAMIDQGSPEMSVRNCIARYGQPVSVFHWLTTRCNWRSVEPGSTYPP